MYAKRYDRKERIHLYVVPEDDYIEESNDFPFIRLLNFVCMILLFVIPSSVDISPYALNIPLQILPPQLFTTSVPIVPTGAQTMPAIAATGWITLYNGSILAQELPNGFIVESASNSEFVTVESIVIPAGNPPNYGIARVQAHAIVPGQAGNIPVLSINQTYGTSLYLKNVTSFSGGADSYTVPTATDEDRQRALASAQNVLQARINRHLLYERCGENMAQQDLVLNVVWSCRFVQYMVPSGVHVLSWQRVGNEIILQVRR